MISVLICICIGLLTWVFLLWDSLVGYRASNEMLNKHIDKLQAHNTALVDASDEMAEILTALRDRGDDGE